MNMKQFAGAVVTGGCVFLMVAGAGAQSGGGTTADLSKEWPTYGHDSGGMRFSPLTQINPANVGKLDVAWVYHMRTAGTPAVAPVAGSGAPNAGRGDGGAVLDTPDQPFGGGGGGRGRGRGGSGFRPSSVTPLVIN